MRKIFLFLTILLIGHSMVGQQWSGSNTNNGIISRTGRVFMGTNTLDQFNNGILSIERPRNRPYGFYLQMGNIVTLSKDRRLINFGVSPSGSIGSSFYDLNGKLRYDFNTTDEGSNLSINDQNASNFFKVSRNNTLGSYIHLPKDDSRVVIGEFGSYLFDEGHKLVVHDGSAKIEGDIFTDTRIGIGTDQFNDTTGSYVLSANGRVRATAVRVYTDWADFVFEENYHLPTLKEVEDYIAKNGHLKDIPSADIVEQEGIDLGEMNKLLLQKMEELTLYVIELNKEIEYLKQH